MSLSRYRKKMDPQQKEQVVVAGHHVLGAQVRERHQQHARAFLDVARVARRDAVRHQRPRRGELPHGGAGQQEQQQPRARIQRVQPGQRWFSHSHLDCGFVSNTPDARQGVHSGQGRTPAHTATCAGMRARPRRVCRLVLSCSGTAARQHGATRGEGRARGRRAAASGSRAGKAWRARADGRRGTCARARCLLRALRVSP